MPPTPHRQHARKPGRRRLLTATVAAGVVAALAAAGANAAFSTKPTSDTGLKSALAKLGSSDANLLTDAKADGDKTVTMMIATAPGKTEEAAEKVEAVKGGSVDRTYDDIGYIRVTVPTGQADQAISSAAKLSSVHAIDLKQVVKLEDPSPAREGLTPGPSAKNTSAAPAPGSYPAPGKDTPADNPYLPTNEIGAVDFVQQHPTMDGRGIRIGVLDSGLDISHPALQKTTTGERKIADWVTSTDPLADGDATWRSMTTAVSGPAFTYADQTWKAPAGSYKINLLKEPDGLGDINHDGDTTDDWGVLYSPAAGTATVDVNDNGDFTDDTPMKPYKDGFQIGYFGKDDPSTEIAERQPFVVQIRKDVPMDPMGGEWAGKKADFVNIGLTVHPHSTHVSGIAAGHSLFGGKMNGVAPGAQIVSSRVCDFVGKCSDIALTEGMIDLIVNRGADVVSVSLGFQTLINDGSDVLSELYSRLVDKYGVQIVVAVGNSGPGGNNVTRPALGDKVISVGASVSKETMAADLGSAVDRDMNMALFSSRGPGADGRLVPTLSAPGAAVSSTPTWQEGEVDSPVSGWSLPPGYSMWFGTSMATPQVAGASALLLSAAKQQGIDLTPVKLRTALTSTAHPIKGVQAYVQGAGVINVVDAWKAIRAGATAHDYTVKAPVDTALSAKLKTPGYGTGLYDREGGLKAGEKKTYDITITRTSGPDRAVPHQLRFANNTADTFRLLGSGVVNLPLNQPVTVRVEAAPKDAGIKSAVLTVDDPATWGIDQRILTTVVAASQGYTLSASGSVQRNDTQSYFVTVPKGTKTLEVALPGWTEDSQMYYSATDPQGRWAGVQVGAIRDVGLYNNPVPGVWEITVWAKSSSKLLDNPYKLDATSYSADFSPETVTMAKLKSGTPAAVSWTVNNNLGAVDGKVPGGPLGSAAQARPSISEGGKRTTTVTVPTGATRLDVAIGNTSDPSADLDLYVADENGDTVAESVTDGSSEERVSLAKPKAGTYTIVVRGYAVSDDTTAYDYRDTIYAPEFGTLDLAHADALKLGTGQSAKISGKVTAKAVPAKGRFLFSEVPLVNASGTAVGTSSVKIEKVTP